MGKYFSYEKYFLFVKHFTQNKRTLNNVPREILG